MRTYHPMRQYRHAASCGVKVCITISKLCRSRIREKSDIIKSTLYVPNNCVLAIDPYSSNIFTTRLRCLQEKKGEKKVEKVKGRREKLYSKGMEER